MIFGTLWGTIPLERLCLFPASIRIVFCLLDQVIFPTETLCLSTGMSAISLITKTLSLPSSLFCGIHAAYDNNQLLAYKFFCHQLFKTSKVFSLFFSKNWHILKVTESKSNTYNYIQNHCQKVKKKTKNTPHQTKTQTHTHTPKKPHHFPVLYKQVVTLVTTLKINVCVLLFID